MSRPLLTLVLAVLVSHCGVEAGNPGSKPPKGTLTVHFAKERDSAQESLSLKLSALELVETGDGGAVIASLTPTVESIDLFGLTGTDDVQVAESADVPVGTYDQIVIRLAGDDPIRYRGKDGKDRNVNLEEPTGRAFRILQDFEVTEGETTALVVSLDPYRSLGEQGGPEDPLVFRPRGDAHHRGRGVRYDGTTTIVGAQWVCAYAYAVQVPPPPPPRPPQGGPIGPGPEGPGGPEGPMGPGPTVEIRPVFATKVQVVKDDTDLCLNAFVKAPVIDGKYELRHLVPASYSLRFFKVDGTSEDAAEDVTMAVPPGAPQGPPPGPGLSYGSSPASYPSGSSAAPLCGSTAGPAASDRQSPCL